MSNTLQKRIMRRVYYAFFLRGAFHPVTVHALVLIVSVFTLSRLVHVAAIIENLKMVRLGELDNYIFATFAQAEFWTLVCTGIIIFTILSLPLRLSLPKHRHIQTI